jgi:hypothetical protein
MLNPVRTSAGWLGGRVALFLLIVLALAVGPNRAEFRALGHDLKQVLPSSTLTAELRAILDGAREFEATERHAADASLRRLTAGIESADRDTRSRLDDRRRQVRAEIAALEARRPSSAEKINALLTGRGLQSALQADVAIALKRRESAELDRLVAVIDGTLDQNADLQARADAAWQATLTAYGLYLARHREYEAFKQRSLVPAGWTAAGSRLRGERDRRLAEYRDAYDTYRIRRRLADAALRVPGLVVQPLASVQEDTLAALDQLIRNRAQAAAALQGLWERSRRVLGTAFAIVVAVTLAPALIRAFWYWLVAPWMARRAPIRLSAADPAATRSREGASTAGRRRISAVSQEIVLAEGETLLVHPEFLQSSAGAGRKDTQWLLSWRFPLSSLASRMVALTRVREAPGHPFVVSSRTDPFVEVGLVPVPAGLSFALQPRHLVGMVHPTGRPMRVRSRWRFGASAWITFQFRYLLFDGPGTLIVQGCRGVRLEPADGHRSIDQRATIGFDAHLAYAPSRSETFSAYLFGIRGLFNDGFRGDGVFVYEEMPYAGRRAGITGRGLEGLTDGLMRVVGI